MPPWPGNAREPPSAVQAAMPPPTAGKEMSST
jgi:hypothetical protein